MCVGPLALVSLVPSTATVHLVNLVVMMINVQQLVLGNIVPMMATVLLENVVILITNVKQETVM